MRFALPNRHHLLFDLARFGMANDREIFQATTEPYGLIEGTVERRTDSTGGCRDRLDFLHGRPSSPPSPISPRREGRRPARWRRVDSAIKDAALLAIADALEARMPEILEANARDLEAGREAGLSRR